MAGHIPANSVWTAMGYTPPRGSCKYKSSMMSPTCPCLRFMLHPVKAATSFDCDGCSHHASFHNLENPAEDAVLEKWQQQASEQDEQAPTRAPFSKKRRLLAPSGMAVETTDMTASTAGASTTRKKK